MIRTGHAKPSLFNGVSTGFKRSCIPFLCTHGGCATSSVVNYHPSVQFHWPHGPHQDHPRPAGSVLDGCSSTHLLADTQCILHSSRLARSASSTKAGTPVFLSQGRQWGQILQRHRSLSCLPPHNPWVLRSRPRRLGTRPATLSRQ